ILICCAAMGQSKVDEKRMDQDIEVAENILGTLIRQQMSKRNFFPMEVEGTYMAGYGVTLRVPLDGPFALWVGGGEPATIDIRGGANGRATYTYSYSAPDGECEDCEKEKKARGAASKAKIANARVISSDSLKESAGKALVEVAKSFLADY